MSMARIKRAAIGIIVLLVGLLSLSLLSNTVDTSMNTLRTLTGKLYIDGLWD